MHTIDFNKLLLSSTFKVVKGYFPYYKRPEKIAEFEMRLIASIYREVSSPLCIIVGSAPYITGWV